MRKCEAVRLISKDLIKAPNTPASTPLHESEGAPIRLIIDYSYLLRTWSVQNLADVSMSGHSQVFCHSWDLMGCNLHASSGNPIRPLGQASTSSQDRHAAHLDLDCVSKGFSSTHAYISALILRKRECVQSLSSVRMHANPAICRAILGAATSPV